MPYKVSEHLKFRENFFYIWRWIWSRGTHTCIVWFKQF